MKKECNIVKKRMCRPRPPGLMNLRNNSSRIIFNDQVITLLDPSSIENTNPGIPQLCSWDYQLREVVTTCSQNIKGLDPE